MLRRLGQAFEILEDISSRHGFRPNVQVYTCLMQACISNRKLDRALALHDTMGSVRMCRCTHASCRHASPTGNWTGLLRCMTPWVPSECAGVHMPHAGMHLQQETGPG